MGARRERKGCDPGEPGSTTAVTVEQWRRMAGSRGAERKNNAAAGESGCSCAPCSGAGAAGHMARSPGNTPLASPPVRSRSGGPADTLTGFQAAPVRVPPHPGWEPGLLSDCEIHAAPPPTGALNPSIPQGPGGLATRREIVDPPPPHRPGLASAPAAIGLSPTQGQRVRRLASREPDPRECSALRSGARPVDASAAFMDSAVLPPGLRDFVYGCDSQARGSVSSREPSDRIRLSDLQPTGAVVDTVHGSHEGPAVAHLLHLAARVGSSHSAVPSSPAGPDGLLAPPPPLCPDGYNFDYYFQSCWRRSPAHRAGAQWKHACRCPSGYSYLAEDHECWERGSLPPAVGADGIGSSDFAGDISVPCDRGYQPECLVEEDNTSSIWVKWDFCTASQEDKLKAAAHLARRVAVSAENFLTFVSTLPEDLAQEYWEYGNTDEGILSLTSWAQSPAPAYWFGPHTWQRVNRAQHVMRMVGDRLRYGFSYLNINTWPLHVRCANTCLTQGLVAMHWAEGFVKICPLAWDLFDSPFGFGDRVGGPIGLAMVLFHELCHRSGLWPILHDADAYGPSASRDLVADGDFSTAYGNIDNYVHWAFARYAWFGRCSVWDPSSHAYSCSSGGDQHGPYPTVCCHQCLGPEGGFRGECQEQ